MIIRPVTVNDYDALWQLSHHTGIGFTSLHPDKKTIKTKIERTIAAFSSDTPADEALYLFVMEHSQSGQVVGICGIESAVGLSNPWYNYRIEKQVHSSTELGIYSDIETLSLCSDHTGHSELCTLFLMPAMRRSYHGHLLSKSRFLFMAAHTQRFSDNIFAELRGYSDLNGESPFWNGLGRHFFHMDFNDADEHVGSSPHFITDLMPRHPIYTNLLPKAARTIIGQTHDNTVPARKMLESEGFEYNHYINIFDAGPLLDAKLKAIRTVKESQQMTVHVDDKQHSDLTPWLLANGQRDNFRCISGSISLASHDAITINSSQAKALQVTTGETLTLSPLKQWEIINAEPTRQKHTTPKKPDNPAMHVSTAEKEC
ncbi:Arginine N-succinyltransferase [invertebrate metagenome]|uniref:Arginine N-succinyltransferase n=1 Tax=invertebrate metagenome TaxID=1711999 RepID=A0A2H9T732_9ZZZZ